MTSSANAAPRTGGKNLALVFEAIDRYDAELALQINGLPIEAEIGRWVYPKGAGRPYLPIPEVMLRAGHNSIAIRYAERNPSKAHALDLRLVELDAPPKDTVHAEVLRIAPDTAGLSTAPLAARFDFEVTGDIPAWSFASAPIIHDDAETSAQLMSAAKALAAKWNEKPARSLSFPDQALAAKRAGLDADPELERISRWILHPALIVEVRTDMAAMEVFDEGHLARLTWGTLMPWRLIGGLHDAPRGRMGPVDVPLDVWFRLDAHGRFVPAAVWQVGVAPGNL